MSIPQEIQNKNAVWSCWHTAGYLTEITETRILKIGHRPIHESPINNGPDVGTTGVSTNREVDGGNRAEEQCSVSLFR